MIKTEALKVGDHMRLANFGATPVSYRLRLLSMGINIGTEIKIMRFAPLGCPMQIEVRGTALILRKNEANLLEWEPI